VRRSLTVLLVALGACKGPETIVVQGEPDLRDPPGSLSFGEVQVGKAVTLTLELHNEGIGGALVSGQWVGDDDIGLLEVPDEVPPDGTAEVRLAFTPSEEGPHEGMLVLETDDEDWPRIELPTSGIGVTARLVISPETLYFGDVAPGESVTRATSLTSSGSGPVHVSTLVFPADEGSAYTWALPEGFEAPFTLPSGTGVTLTVTYAPATDDALSGELVVASDDALRPYQPIRLLAGDGGGGAEPPQVEIVAPVWGTSWLTTETVAVDVQAVDPDDLPEDLTVLLYVDGKLEGSGTPDAEGRWTTTLATLDAGEHEILARALDPDGGMDEDTVSVDVQSEPDLHYTLSGGPSVFEYWSVDDDVRVYVDGVEVFADTDEHQSTHPPLRVDAAAGSTIRIVATDVNACRKAIDELWLHFGTTRSTKLVDATSASSCPADADYDETYTGPWPNDFVDVSAVIDLP
jgi:hypothetical protein